MLTCSPNGTYNNHPSWDVKWNGGHVATIYFVAEDPYAWHGMAYWAIGSGAVSAIRYGTVGGIGVSQFKYESMSHITADIANVLRRQQEVFNEN